MPSNSKKTKKNPKVYWITRKDQLRVLASAIRLDILDRLGAQGPLSVKQLAAATGKNATPIYHHLEQMQKVGLVRPASASETRGRPAVVYEAPGELIRLARAPTIPANRTPMARIGRIAASQAGKDYALGFKSDHWDIDGPARNHWFFRCVMQPSPQRLAKINALLDEVSALIWTPDPSPGKLAMSVALFLAPLKPPRGSATKSGRKASSPTR
jgi:DNA-binding transcriptional ArsR family regulator